MNATVRHVEGWGLEWARVQGRGRFSLGARGVVQVVGVIALVFGLLVTALAVSQMNAFAGGGKAYSEANSESLLSQFGLLGFVGAFSLGIGGMVFRLGYTTPQKLPADMKVPTAIKSGSKPSSSPVDAEPIARVKPAKVAKPMIKVKCASCGSLENPAAKVCRQCKKPL